jgi:hypothetical protein
MVEVADAAPLPVASLVRADGANANAAAFWLASAKIVADHPGVAAGWPLLAETSGTAANTG